MERARMWTKEELEEIAGRLIALVPCIVIAWICATMVETRDHVFWKVLGAMAAAKFAFWLIDVIGTTFAFVVYDKRRKVSGLLEYLDKHSFPRHRESSSPHSMHT
jgi:hypothetical protein